jgi:5'-nucleotidase
VNKWKDRKPNILITNDDGIFAPGIFNLIESVADKGNIVVVAPSAAQSGMSHAISLGKPLRLESVKLPLSVEAYSCNGTPVDCVKLSIAQLQFRPDFILSGINHGANVAVSVLYSGTMSAAMEGAIMGIPSVGFSLCNHSHEADFTAAKEVVSSVFQQLLTQEIPSHLLLNVNIPDIPLELIQGIKITRQAQGRFVEEFDKRTDPYGKEYYWLTGKFELSDEGEGHDIQAIQNNFVSITPVQMDLTAYQWIETLKTWHF